MSVNDLINLIEMENTKTNLTTTPEETTATNTITTDNQEDKIPKITTKTIKEDMDLLSPHDDENNEPEEEDKVIQYLNEKIRKLDEQITVATKDESLDTNKDILLRAKRSKKNNMRPIED